MPALPSAPSWLRSHFLDFNAKIEPQLLNQQYDPNDFQNFIRYCKIGGLDSSQWRACEAMFRSESHCIIVIIYYYFI